MLKSSPMGSFKTNLFKFIFCPFKIMLRSLCIWGELQKRPIAKAAWNLEFGDWFYTTKNFGPNTSIVLRNFRMKNIKYNIKTKIFYPTSSFPTKHTRHNAIFSKEWKSFTEPVNYYAAIPLLFFLIFLLVLFNFMYSRIRNVYYSPRFWGYMMKDGYFSSEGRQRFHTDYN